MNGPAAGIALLCDDQGALVSIARDELGLTPRLAVGHSWLLLLDPASVHKGLAFWETLRSQGAAFGWELNVSLDGQVTALHVVGGAGQGVFVIVAARSRNGMVHLYEEISLINNEQMNALRAASKDHALEARTAAERQDALYNELSRLNNELITLQRELARKNQELARLNELKNQFLGMAAHDLRSPLGVMQIYAQFLLEEADALSPQQREFLEVIHSSSHFMLGLVNNLLDVAQIEAGAMELDLEPVDLCALVERHARLNQPLAERKGITLSVVCASGLPPLFADAAKLEQLLNNLVSNAVKFSPPGATVEVRGEQEGQQLHLMVRDQGQGIPPEALPRLFKPFPKISAHGTAGEKSTGLGLVIARRVVEGHGGRIWAESEVGVGSAFHVLLPLPTFDGEDTLTLHG